MDIVKPMIPLFMGGNLACALVASLGCCNNLEKPQMHILGMAIFLLMAFIGLASLSEEDFDEPAAAAQVWSAAQRR